ncbi:MAG TPA: hypothetical protein VGB92_03585 [Longimicrobium sp.]|jgi:hypothetical protein
MKVTASKLLRELDRAPLSQSMHRALEVARRYSDAAFLHWLELELFGYFSSNPALSDRDTVPVYRTVAGEHGDEAGRPLVLSNPDLGFVYETRVRWGVAELEEYQRRGGHITVREPVSANLILQHLGVEVTRYKFDSRQLVGVLSAIRARLAENLHRYEHMPATATARRRTTRFSR